MKRFFKFLIIFVLFLITFAPLAIADGVYNYKITSANFDVSNSVIVLTSPDTIDGVITDSIKLVEMDNPKRAYFDINSAVLTIPKQDWTFSTGGIKQVKINQFTTEPNVVRVVIYYDDDFDISKVKFARINNNLIIKFKKPQLDSTYFQNVYRDDHSSSSDFYEYLTVKMPAPEPTPGENIVEQIHDAFNTTMQVATQQIPPENLFIKKELTLNSKYYLNKITPKPNSILISGFGAMTIEKPMVLKNPSRLVYDIPNAVVRNELRNVEHKINETDTVKVGQFEANKARIVITTNDVTKYIPIFSSDNQSILIANYEKVEPQSIMTNTTANTNFYYEKIDAQTSSMIMSFNNPVVMGVDRTAAGLTLYLYNNNQFDTNAFNAKYGNTIFGHTTITKLAPLGVRIDIPVEKDAITYAYEGSDSKTIKVKIKQAKKEKTVITRPTSNNKKASRLIVIDPGHGGEDCGAIRDDIMEKDIVLDISKRVEKLLRNKGYGVAMTRTDDSTVSLQKRVEFSEARKPDIFVSIHVNSSVKPEITGIETHYYRQESLNLAQTIHASMASNIKSNDRGLFKSKFYVINHTTAPAILLEIGFISNTNERDQLVSDKRKQATAEAIVEGVENYFKQH